MLAQAEETLAGATSARRRRFMVRCFRKNPATRRRSGALPSAIVESGDLARARQTLGLVRPDGAGDEAIRAVEAELALKEKAADGGRHGALARQGRSQPRRSSGAFRSGAGARRQGRPAGRHRRTPGNRAPRPRMERTGRAQATRHPIRGDGPDRRTHRRRAAQAVDASCSREMHAPLSRAPPTFPPSFRCFRWRGCFCCRGRSFR